MVERKFGENDVFAAVAREGEMFFGKSKPEKPPVKKAKKKPAKKR